MAARRAGWPRWATAGGELFGLGLQPARARGPGAADHDVERPGVQDALLIAGQVDHPGHGPVGIPDPGGSPDVIVDAQDGHTLQAGRVTDSPCRLGLNGIPAGVPVHPQMPSDRRDGRVIEGQRVGGPPDRPRGEPGPRRRQVVDLAERPTGTGRLGAPPHPLDPSQRDRHPETRRVCHDMHPPGITEASLDPFRGYANAIRDELPDAVAVLDAFHVVKLGTSVVDEVRRRVQQETLARRGHKDDPLYKIRGLLRRGREHLSDKQTAKLEACLCRPGTRTGRSPSPGTATSRLRSMYQAERPADGRAIAEKVIASFPDCPIPEVARLGRTLRQWKEHVLARFDTERISNGGTEAVNLIIEKTRRLAHGFRTFDHYRLRILLAASGLRPYRRDTHG